MAEATSRPWVPHRHRRKRRHRRNPKGTHALKKFCLPSTTSLGQHLTMCKVIHSHTRREEHLTLTSLATIFLQFNATQPGRYPVNWWTYLIGYGPTLHVVGTPGAFDRLAQQFSNSNVGGMTSVSFTAHIDSAFAYNPIGLLFHLFKDLLGAGGRNQCPG